MSAFVAPTLDRKTVLAWRNAMFVVFVLSGLGIASWVARLPAVRDNLDLNTSSVGVLIFGMSAGSIIGLVAAPVLLAKVGPRLGIISSLMLVSIGLVLIGFGSDVAYSPALTFLGLALFGAGNGATDVMMNVEAAAAERLLGKTVMPLMHAFFSVGTVVGAGIGALASLLEIAVFWHLLFMAVLAGVTVVVAVRYIPIRTNLGDADSSSNTAPKVPFAERLKASLRVWRDLRLILIGAVMLGMAFAEGSANDWIAIATVDGHHQDNTMGAVVFAVFVAAMTVGRVAGGPLLDRFGRVPILRATAVIAAAGLLIFILSDQLWAVIIGAILWGIGASLGFPVGMSAAADDEKNAAARVSAVSIVGYCAFLAGPPILGVLGDAFGILNALFVVLILVVVSFFASPATRERTYS
jgi:MFS family permease